MTCSTILGQKHDAFSPSVFRVIRLKAETAGGEFNGQGFIVKINGNDGPYLIVGDDFSPFRNDYWYALSRERLCNSNPFPTRTYVAMQFDSSPGGGIKATRTLVSCTNP